jgi:hypothetical protein
VVNRASLHCRFNRTPRSITVWTGDFSICATARHLIFEAQSSFERGLRMR